MNTAVAWRRQLAALASLELIHSRGCCLTERSNGMKAWRRRLFRCCRERCVGGVRVAWLNVGSSGVHRLSSHDPAPAVLADAALALLRSSATTWHLDELFGAATGLRALLYAGRWRGCDGPLASWTLPARTGKSASGRVRVRSSGGRAGRRGRSTPRLRRSTLLGPGAVLLLVFDSAQPACPRRADHDPPNIWASRLGCLTFADMNRGWNFFSSRGRATEFRGDTTDGAPSFWRSCSLLHRRWTG